MGSGCSTAVEHTPRNRAEKSWVQILPGDGLFSLLYPLSSASLIQIPQHNWFSYKILLSRAAWGEASFIRMDWAKQKLHDEERRERGKNCSIPKHQDSKATWVSCPGRVTIIDRWYWQKCRRRPRRWSRSAGRCRLWAPDTSSRRPSGCLRTCSSSLWECRPARIKKLARVKRTNRWEK